jgi:LmbE family N-acetylglucosaminyl deacetylase
VWPGLGLKLPKEPRALVVAHPDDETLWFGGLLIAHPGDWTVICASTPRRDPVRASKFLAACEQLGARGRVLPRIESEPSEPLAHLEEIELQPYACVVTHNSVGEYGHLHHRSVHEHVMRSFGGPVLVSGYGLKSARYTIALREAQWRRKLAALMAYDHVAPYAGIDGPSEKWEALLHRYGYVEGIDLKKELFLWARR